MHWRRKWQPTPVFLPGESQGWGSLVGCRLWGRIESDTTEVTQQQQQQQQHDVQFSSVAQSFLTLCGPMDCSAPGFPVHHQLPELGQTLSIGSVMPSDHLIFCHPLLLPSLFPHIRVFSSESVIRIRWPKYWSFSISPSNEYSGLISFMIA